MQVEAAGGCSGLWGEMEGGCAEACWAAAALPVARAAQGAQAEHANTQLTWRRCLGDGPAPSTLLLLRHGQARTFREMKATLCSPYCTHRFVLRLGG